MILESFVPKHQRCRMRLVFCEYEERGIDPNWYIGRVTLNPPPCSPFGNIFCKRYIDSANILLLRTKDNADKEREKERAVVVIA